jgi:hypothetical protein
LGTIWGQNPMKRAPRTFHPLPLLLASETSLREPPRAHLGTARDRRTDDPAVYLRGEVKYRREILGILIFRGMTNYAEKGSSSTPLRYSEEMSELGRTGLDNELVDMLIP